MHEFSWVLSDWQPLPPPMQRFESINLLENNNTTQSGKPHGTNNPNHSFITSLPFPLRKVNWALSHLNLCRTDFKKSFNRTIFNEKKNILETQMKMLVKFSSLKLNFYVSLSSTVATTELSSPGKICEWWNQPPHRKRTSFKEVSKSLNHYWESKQFLTVSKFWFICRVSMLKFHWFCQVSILVSLNSNKQNLRRPTLIKMFHV